MLKKILSFVVLVFSIFILAGCEESKVQKTENNAKYNIVCSSFPEYDWVRNITEGSDNVSVKLLVDDGTDIHSFQPSVDDMVNVSECDMFIYVGGESIAWMDDMLDNAENENMTIINLVETPDLIVKTEEVTDGMDTHDHEEEDHDHEEEVYDEHVWLSLKNAAMLCDYITECLMQMDADYADLYKANNESYKAKLNELDEAFQIAVDTAKIKTLVFADRFPFRYLTDDYGIEYYAAFPGCSTETDASFKTIIFLAEKVDELNLKNVIVIDGSDEKIAESVISNTADKNIETVKMNSMQSINAEDIESGEKYLKYMEENLQALVQALSINEE